MTHSISYRLNSYSDVVASIAAHPRIDAAIFDDALTYSLNEWRNGNRSGVWLKIPAAQSHLIETCQRLGFTCHHANRSVYMMVAWLANTPPKFPAYGTHNVGVSVVLVRDGVVPGTSEILFVRERFARKHRDHWKCVSGAVEEGEFIEHAAQRELFEETGLRGSFKCVLGFWNRYGTKFGRSELHFGCYMRLAPGETGSNIRLQEDELVAARWFPLDASVFDTASGPRISADSVESVWINMLLANGLNTPRGLNMREMPDFRGHPYVMHMWG